MPNIPVPVIAAAAGLAIGAVLTPIAAPAVVGLWGFGAAGPVAGTAAAAAQAGIGNVVAGSSFAVLQSIGMGGAVPVVGQACGAAIVGGTAVAGRAILGLVRKVPWRP
ncbi:hypothetical protein FA95DRAFT_1568002 [Auriscalpium vulgare]|uniref:Uncharacterized protein n=1 Tax=Auriscalpium vulgare TaxID=40419 RepID=A0ACB8R198_9AGAM|nr:hypothetical protein FA95DRAFT_1568002 [Auriscalpium vulgare]